MHTTTAVTFSAAQELDFPTRRRLLLVQGSQERLEKLSSKQAKARLA